MARRSLSLLVCAVPLFLLACASPAEPGPAHPTIEYVTRQEVLTPLPLRVRLPASYGAEHVVVLFRTWGSRGWKGMELGRRGQTWSGEVSCREVSTVTGDTKYFFVALDGQGEVVGGSGTSDWPHVATIVGALQGGAQALPGGTIPMRCHDVADCPPDFPGCPAYAMVRQSCRSDRDCADRGQRCAWDGYCGAPSSESLEPFDAPNAEEDELEAAVRRVQRRFGRNAKASLPKSAPRSP